MTSVITFMKGTPTSCCPNASASGHDGVQTSFFVGWVSCCYCSTTLTFGLLGSSALVLLRVCLPQCASAIGSLQSSLLAPPLRVEPAFSPQSDRTPWNPSLRSYSLLQETFPLTCRVSITRRRCYYAVAHHTRSRTWQCTGVPQWHSINAQSYMALKSPDA